MLPAWELVFRVSGFAEILGLGAWALLFPAAGSLQSQHHEILVHTSAKTHYNLSASQNLLMNRIKSYEFVHGKQTFIKLILALRKVAGMLWTMAANGPGRCFLVECFVLKESTKQRSVLGSMRVL